MIQNDNELVDFLLQETGDSLYIVVEYGPEQWQFLYVRETVRDRIQEWKTNAAEIIQHFCLDARRNTEREELFDVGSFYCSLHLFDELVVLHFSQPDEQGVVFGYDPTAASNLTDFVQLCVPQIRSNSLSDINENPTWNE